MKIKPIENGKKYQVDFGVQIPKVKDPRPKKNRWVGRTTRFNTKEEAQQWAAQVKELDNRRDTTMSGFERMDYITARNKLNEAGWDEKSITAIAEDWLKYRSKVRSEETVEECYNQWIQSYEKKQEENSRSGQSAENLTRAKKHLLPYFHLEINQFLK